MVGTLVFTHQADELAAEHGANARHRGIELPIVAEFEHRPERNVRASRLAAFQMQSYSTSLHSRTALRAAGGAIAALLLALAAIIGMPHGALAHHAPGHGGGPGGGSEPDPPPPTTLDGGTIYYFESGTSERLIHSIKPDGSDDTVIVGVENNGGTKASRQLHNGKRWYVTLRENEGVPGFFPGGPSNGRLWELDVVPEGGSPIPLTDNAGSCINI